MDLKENQPRQGDSHPNKFCPFCQSPIKEEAEVAICSECLTPHHLECWQANSGCTTYGCQGHYQAPAEPLKTCPHCNGQILKRAVKCKHCKTMLEPAPQVVIGRPIQKFEAFDRITIIVLYILAFIPPMGIVAFLVGAIGLGADDPVRKSQSKPLMILGIFTTMAMMFFNMGLQIVMEILSKV